MNPIDYLKEHGFNVTSDPTQYREHYPNGPMSPWGYRNYWERHNGKVIYYDSFCDGYHNAYDLSRYEGAPLPAVVDGVIVDGTRQNGNFGGTVVLIDHNGDYQYIYGHVKNIQVKVGDEVKQGDVLAYQSNTNYYNNPMASHLHFQVQTAGYRAEKAFVCDGINPLNIDVNKYVGGDNKMGKKIALDIGHGVNTFPANGKGVYRGGKGYAEFSFNNKLGKRIKELLELNGFNVVMAQPFDSNDVGLVRRTNYYDAQRCDLGLSIHANAGVANAGGRCAFYWTTSNQGKRFATNIVNNMRSMGYGLHGNGLHASQYNSWTNLHMVRECTTFPMVLVEHGFMTNDLDFPLIFGNRQNQYIEDMAEADVKAVCQYFGVTFKKSGSKPSTPSKSTPTKGTTLHRVQVGAYGKKGNANTQITRVKKAGFDAFLAYDSKDELYRVQVGAFSKKANADNLLKQMKNKGFKDAFIAKNDGHTINDDGSDAVETVSNKDEPKTGGAGNIKYDGDWRFNRNTQVYWVPVKAKYTLAHDTYVYDKLPKIIRANRLSTVKAGTTINVVELCRFVEPSGKSYEWAVYRNNKGQLRYLPIKEWAKRPGKVTNSGLWGRFI